MESMRDIDRAMEREIAKGSCPLRFVRIEFNNSPYQQIASKEKLLEVLSYLLRTGDYGRFAVKGTGNNVYMDIKGRKPTFKRTHSFIDRNNIFVTIRRYGKKLKPDFDGHTYLETVQCIFELPEEEHPVPSGLPPSSSPWGRSGPPRCTSTWSPTTWSSSPWRSPS